MAKLLLQVKKMQGVGVVVVFVVVFNKKKDLNCQNTIIDHKFLANPFPFKIMNPDKK